KKSKDKVEKNIAKSTKIKIFAKNSKLVLALFTKIARIRAPHRAPRMASVPNAALQQSFCYRVQLRKIGSCEEFRGLLECPLMADI
ncbi:MAG TPA: hypothetical protein DDW21_03610, partial [Verrucomicrobiales bacterium]|nr:hypothetical protein [Verrucomicrobiales bacterium]